MHTVASQVAQYAQSLPADLLALDCASTLGPKPVFIIAAHMLAMQSLHYKQCCILNLLALSVAVSNPPGVCIVV